MKEEIDDKPGIEHLVSPRCQFSSINLCFEHDLSKILQFVLQKLMIWFKNTCANGQINLENKRRFVIPDM